MKTKNNGTKKTWEVSSSRLCGETQSECSGKTWATHHKATSAVIWANWSKLSNHLNIINDGCKPWQCVTPNVQTVRTMNRILKTHLYDEQRVCSTLLLTCKLLKICWSFVPSSPAGLYPSRVKPMKRQQEPLGFRSPYTRQQTNQKTFESAGRWLYHRERFRKPKLRPKGPHFSLRIKKKRATKLKSWDKTINQGPPPSQSSTP